MILLGSPAEVRREIATGPLYTFQRLGEQHAEDRLEAYPVNFAIGSRNRMHVYKVDHADRRLGRGRSSLCVRVMEGGDIAMIREASTLARCVGRVFLRAHHHLPGR